MTRKQAGRGLGRYTVLQADPAQGPAAGWVIWDSRRQRRKGRIRRGSRGFARACSRADRLNKRAR